MINKKTKIVATISDVNCSEELLKELYEAGMNVVRLNTAHQDFEGTKKVIENVRKISNKIPFLLDTKGPEVRTKELGVPLEVKKGEKIYVLEKANSKLKGFEVNYKNFCRDLKKGNKILIDDGDVEIEVIDKTSKGLLCEVKNSGFIKNKKSVNAPGVHLKLPALSDKDRDYIDFAIKNDLDFIAHSFVRNKEDVKEIQKILDKKKSKIKIIAKIENQEGVDNIEEILDYVYGVMVARGDLAIEIPYEKVPQSQRDIVEKCIKKRKPVIVATQMLHTMIENPRPTRAEVSDVANAIYLGADAIMLSGETAYGKYPLESVKVMSRVAQEIEKQKKSFEKAAVQEVNRPREFLAKSAVRASMDLPSKAILTDTMTGRTARNISAYRGKNPIYAVCYDERVMRELALSYGVEASYRKPEKTSSDFLKSLALPLLKDKGFNKEDLVVIVGGSFSSQKEALFMEINKVGNLI